MPSLAKKSIFPLSKFEKKNLILLGELSQMDVISTDKPLPYELEKYCHEYDILVLTA